MKYKFDRFNLKGFFRLRYRWRLRHYASKQNWKAFWLYTLFGWHIPCDVVTTPRFSKDIEHLRTYDYDIRAILLENSTKDIWNEGLEDKAFIHRIEVFCDETMPRENRAPDVIWE